MTRIIGIKLSEKADNAVIFQKILTEFNCIIRLRIGINNKQGMFCPESGIILLQTDECEDAVNLEKRLLDIEGIEIQRMIF